MSPLRVLRTNKAHCLEGALLACVCFMLAGRKPIIVSHKAGPNDEDHIITVFKEGGYYGALSKTNHAVLRYRDPIYRSIRELAMTYFHEYFLYSNGAKTMLGYTDPINMLRFGTKWMTQDDDLWDIAERIYDTPINSVVPRGTRLRRTQRFEIETLRIQEWKK